MPNNLLSLTEALENLDTYIKRTILIKISYLLLGFIVNIKFVPIPSFVLIAIFLMIIYALIVFFLVHRYIIEPESLVNTLFLLILLDILLITIIISFLGIILYILYPFYILLAFMTLPRHKAIYLTIWVFGFYLGLVFLHYFQIFQPAIYFSPEETSPQNFAYVVTLLSLYLITLSFLGVRCYDFYRIITGRINGLKRIYLTLEEKKESLEVRVLARGRELKEQKESLERKVKERRKELNEENKRLEERMIELEKFGKVVLGRKMKMKELKQEMAELKRKLK